MKEAVITVKTVFAGTQTERQAFIDLIRQRRGLARTNSPVDEEAFIGYTEGTPRRGIHSGMENAE